MLRELLNEINEQDPRNRQETKTKQKDINLDDLFRTRQKGEVEPVKPEPKQEQPKGQPRRMSREETLRRLQGVQPSEEMMRKLGSIDPTMQDEISDEEALRRAGATAAAHQTRTPTPGEVEPKVETPNLPVKPNTIPKIISKDLEAAGVVTPEWHMVKSLPGYLAAPIRSIGRSVFRPFTRTPIEDIQVIANLMGQGPNDERELNAVAGHLMKNAIRDRDAEIVFHDKIPDYGADIKVFKDKGVTYMLVKDFAGGYIYAWPSDQEHKKLETQAPKLEVKEGRMDNMTLDQLRQELADVRGEIQDAKDTRDDPETIAYLQSQRDKVKKAIVKAKSRVLREAKKNKPEVPSAPRAKHLHDILASRKAGGHYTEKSDYKRSKEKQKFRKELAGD